MLDPDRGALTQILAEYAPPGTPVIVEHVAEQIDAIVRPIRCTGWQESQPGDREVRRQLSRRTSPREHVRIRAARQQNADRIARILAPRMISIGIRSFTVAGGRHPSREKILSYAMARARYKAEHRTPEMLWPNETWVKPYPLG